MIKLLHNQIPFNSSLKNQFVIAIILGLLLALILIFLEPFDTYRFESNQKNVIFCGFGILFSLLYLMNARIETWWYGFLDRKWTVKNEIFTFIFLVVVSSIPIHFYNQIFLNDLLDHDFVATEYVKHLIWFFRNSVLPIMTILLPFFIYIRNRLGKMSTPESLLEIELSGVNKGEKMVIQKKQLLFVKSSENYVEIFYDKNEGIQNETYRNTLGAIKKQVPFMKQCHRSYLVNVANIKSITGNSQNARIKFQYDNLDVPLSNTFYKSVKSSLRA
ncbi:MAG: LytTR family DNA-binding domain-containing protein [Bacteroidota bacterium]